MTESRSKFFFQLIVFCFCMCLLSPAFSQDAGTPDRDAVDKALAKPPYSPYAGRNFPTRPFFGDTHLHTSYSMDAGAFGCRLDPRDAYRFARGEEIMASSQQLVKLSRPLDFLVVADHSDGMGFFPLLFSGDPKTIADPQGKKWYEMIQSGKGADAAVDIIINFGKGLDFKRNPACSWNSCISKKLGKKQSRRQRNSTILDASLRLSASNGLRTPVAITCIAM